MVRTSRGRNCRILAFVTELQQAGPITSRVPALDGLRGVAVLGVLLFHTGHLGGGFLGVDLFFALSGYLITDLLLREARETGTVSLIAFWGRRIRRLGPALAVVLAGVTVVVRVFGTPDLVRTTLADAPWVQANLVNWHLLQESAGYWDRFGAQRVFEHLWSIAVEEQFYLVWPVVVVLVARRGRRVEARVATVAALVSLASLILMIGLSNPADPTRVYTGTDTRAFSLLLGALLATPAGRAASGRAVGRRSGVAQVVLVVGLGLAWLTVDGSASPGLFSGGLFAHSLASAMLIGLCVQAPGSAVSRVLSVAPLRWVGSISYSLYLWHWPVIVLLAPHLGGLGDWARTAVLALVSIGLATLSKYLVEDPIRFRARWARGTTGLLAFVVLMLALALLWVALPAPAAPVVDVTDLG